MTAVNSATVRDRILGPALEARARNLEQYDPSPEIDSLLEELRARVQMLAVRRDREALLALIDEVIASNDLEGREELSVAGVADQLATDLADYERNGKHVPSDRLGCKAIARRLRDPLRLLADPAGRKPAEIVEASRVVRDTIKLVTQVQLLSPTVEHELGKKKFATLVEIDRLVRS